MLSANLMAEGSSPHARGARIVCLTFRLSVRIIPACAGSTPCSSRRARSPWDHPRMRGEHSSSSSACVCLPGSSPHARGAHDLVPHRPALGGIIPACAGSTRARLDLSQLRRDHPRMRGEHLAEETRALLDMGSSPHARGAHWYSTAVRHLLGIIPACAGSTVPCTIPDNTAWDHPRMRGEHKSAVVRSYRRAGSSPHARGARGCSATLSGLGGIIPACAGSTIVRRVWPRLAGDHPRMRGEHLRLLSPGLTVSGSSPHARGALSQIAPPSIGRRIIPACAGSTGTTARGSTTSWDHPRMRGEHDPPTGLGLPGVGSSPHARGAPTAGGTCPGPSGIIPACAGSTGRALSGKVNSRDHPRMRGEHGRITSKLCYLLGSSPHARGAPSPKQVCTRVVGIIPACAGSTIHMMHALSTGGDHPRMRGEHCCQS